ncbi:molybdopterin-dependent oxidoreductase [Oceanibium sediminis]|uniref:molybdopterin-dependent oxidoreductase n=1 Tax=Oceanibium sediminis TaxID=2026339 RepID=UPI000DD418C7|nr:molybdopterin cofactor-binding domain-containing protein [Oceanibium sediminis]
MNRPFPTLALTVNGTPHPVEAAPGRRLSEVLREGLGLRGTKVGCDAGDCGACTVLIDGAPVCACLMPAIQAEGRNIETVEALAEAPETAALQRAFLRHGAAQCGICTPGMLMSAVALLRSGAALDRDTVENSLGGVLCRCTGYAKIIDAVLDAGGTARAPDPAAGAAVGAPVERLDGVPKVNGTERFGADEVPPGCLLVRAVRSPHAAARFSLGDTAGWASARNVQVFTAADIAGRNIHGVIPQFVDQPSLAVDHVRQPAEPVAIVVGPEAAVADLDLTDFPVTWRPEVPTLDMDSARSAALLHETREANTLITGRVVTGDAEAALAASAVSAEVEVQTSYVEHAYVEPEAGVAWLDGDTLVIRACTQAPAMDRDDTAAALGLPVERVRIIPAAAGGGFGSKLDLSLQPLIGLATLKTGKPCRMTYTRAESMASTTKRHPARMRARIGADAQGKVTGMIFDGDFNTGAYASWGPTVAVRVPVHASGPYRTPNYRAEARAIHTNGPTSGAFRGFGVPQAAVVQEVLYDDLALALGQDRLAFRLHNALRDGEASVCGQVLQGVGIADCLEALAPEWRARLTACGAFNAAEAGPLRRGIGVASCWYGCGNTGLPNPSTIRIGITPEGRLRLHQGATDIGQGANTVIAQIAADALGVPLSTLELVGPDTALTPDCGKTSASRQTYVTGSAALRAGQSLRARLLQMTNQGPDAPIALPGGGAVIVGTGPTAATIPLGELGTDANGYALSVEESYDPPTRALDQDGQGIPYAVYGYGAQLAEVSVDMELGTVKVLDIVAAHDLGRVINPLLAEGQVEGGIAQGLGMALMEEYIPGRTDNLHDYLIPTTGDMPRIRSIFIEKSDPEGPMGAKGLGEHVLIPTAPAILNAIRHASGARITRLPALPHRVLAAIRAAKGRP